jgi:probable rRNA maturation factor
LGDIAIAPDTARRYARKNGRRLSDELRVLILHGVLHLLGYDHETDRGEMDRIERKMRRRFGLA